VTYFLEDFREIVAYVQKRGEDEGRFSMGLGVTIENRQKIRSYFPEDFWKVSSYFPEVFLKITSSYLLCSFYSK
jgi:hypothetical protein